jgi:DNA-binding IclR family transcriptional regulator
MLEYSPPADADGVTVTRRGECTVALWDGDPAASSTAVPIFAPTDALLGALAVSGPADRLDAGRHEPATRVAARTIERRLGAARVD